MSIPSVLVETLVPSSEEFQKKYEIIKDELLEVLITGYGKKAYPKSLHDFRIRNEEQYLFLLREVESERILGCSYVRRDGKRGATAVLPEMSGNGFGRLLVQESLKKVECQYGEISINNEKQLNLLKTCGFRGVHEIGKVYQLLGELRPLILSWRIVNGSINYIRKSRDNPNIVHRFVLMSSLGSDDL
ncbi:GNAT family N-acetyltransferase [Pseudoalteromonas umbrosa]|uniref:GNAT family N-acetyltransferase n=1 Tax=Pseudoalteromonas umbrosa TaxID=3048489 RepID=UPI0024C425C6|nr:GNAT family N-acetyltransferase [Pseudoalteromonas sp. B95]MDK1285755.1 hypothetical protein [Pseudoalteromonas sp. B95]